MDAKRESDNCHASNTKTLKFTSIPRLANVHRVEIKYLKNYTST
jgi:hypothetical protein